MSKQKRIKKIVKSRLQRIKPDTGLQEFADDAAKIAALKSMNLLADGDGRQTNGGLGDGGLLSVLGISNPGAINEILDVDLDEAELTSNDAFPRDAREQKDTDGDGVGDNKEIHDTALLILEQHAEAVQIFSNFAGYFDVNLDDSVAELLSDFPNEPANHAADNEAYLNAYETLRDGITDVNQDIASFESLAATAGTLFNSIKDLTAEEGVLYRTDPADADTLKLVTDSLADAKKNIAELTNNTPQLVDPNLAGLTLMDIEAQKNTLNGFKEQFDALTDPETIPADAE